MILAQAIMADSKLMNSKWERKMVLIISVPTLCSIIIWLLSSRTSPTLSTLSVPNA